MLLRGPNEDAAVAVLTMANPARRNAFSATMVAELAAHVDALESWCAAPGSSGVGLLLRGEGTFFCSGMDLHLASALPRADALAVCAVMGDSLHRLHALPLVSVAAVEGGAFGGGAETMTACDHRVVAHSATVRFVHARMGLSPGWGGAGRLTRLVGRQHALRLLTTAQPLNAEAALAIGLADAVARRDEEGATGGGGTAVAVATEWLERITQFAPDVIRSNKLAVMAASLKPNEEAARIERELFCGLWGGKANSAALANITL